MLTCVADGNGVCVCVFFCRLFGVRFGCGKRAFPPEWVERPEIGGLALHGRGGESWGRKRVQV